MSDKRIKVRVTITVELDPDEWSDTYGEEGNPAIRQAVKDYIGYGIQSSGPFGNGTVPSARVTFK